MGRAPFGEICIELGLLSAEQVARVVELQASRPGTRFGDLAREVELLDDEAVARALAHQYRLNLVPEERLRRLTVSADLLALLPPELVRRRRLLPTFHEPERGVFTLVCADPTDISSLRAAQAAVQASRLRLFVAPRDALDRLIERLLPAPDAASAARGTVLPPRAPGVTVVFEPDPARAGVLRELERLEGRGVEVIEEPGKVTALLERAPVERLLHRSGISTLVQAHLPSWRRARPEVQVRGIESFGSGRRYGVPTRRTRDFLLGLLEFTLLAHGDRPVEARIRVRRTLGLVREMAVELDLPEEVRDAAVVAALFADIESLALGVLPTETGEGTFASAVALVQPFAPPWDLVEIYGALERRAAGLEAPSRSPAVELLFTARAAVRAGLADGADPVEALGIEATRHDGLVLQALASVLGRRARLQPGPLPPSSSVVVVSRDAGVLAGLEARLVREGMQVVVADDPEEARVLVRGLRPAAVLVDDRLPTEAGLGLVVRLVSDESTRDVPVLLVIDPGEPRAVTRAMELGAEDVLERPIHPDVLLARLRRAMSRRSPPAAAVSGRLGELTLPDLLQVLTLGARTALVQIATRQLAGNVQVRGGELVAAAFGGLEGEDALDALVSVDAGRFEVAFRDEGRTNLRGSSEFLLLEALRRRDERLRRARES